MSVILLNTVSAFSVSLNENTISYADKFMMNRLFQDRGVQIGFRQG